MGKVDIHYTATWEDVVAIPEEMLEDDAAIHKAIAEHARTREPKETIFITPMDLDCDHFVSDEPCECLSCQMGEEGWCSDD